MDTTYLGRTGVKVSELCLGTMTFGAAADEATSRDIMTACFDAGINMIDCADIYTGGESERIVGRMIAGRRHDVVLATKAYFPKGDGPNERGASRRHMTRALESSLERLGTDHV
ncbi:MAG: aldo/keto reductase, partial [Myxococcota bacterium]